MISIKRGDPQPLPCPNCESKMGYQVSDTIRTRYVEFYHEDGESDGGMYSDSQTLINEGVRAFCANCLGSLPFKMDKR